MKRNPALISALVDGQLRGWRRWRAHRLVSRNPVWAQEYRREQRLRKLLAAHQPHVEMSDSADFFWSKVRGEIERGDTAKTESSPAPSRLLQNRFALATAAVALVAAVMMFSSPRSSTVGNSHSPRERPAQVEHVSTAVPHTTATAFKSSEPDVTVIWISDLPWTKDMTDMKTIFATLDT